MDNSSLGDFGVDDTESIPPLVYRKNAVESPTSPGKPAGFIGIDRRRDKSVYITRRVDHLHYYKSGGGGYAISDEIINRLDRTPISRIIVHVADSGGLYEFGYHQYENEATPVPESLLIDEDDPQGYVATDDCLNSWEGVGGRVYVESFEVAMERISGRGWW
jgi:hypothetical protein